jgi:glyoxylase-like metal-dependent hydrolase (beta-lactamase superfamily II)
VAVTTSRRDAATTTAVRWRDEVLLVDPNWDPDELTGLADWFTDRGLRVTAGFATHAHHDHVLWHPGLGPAPRWASATTVARAARHRELLVGELGPDFPAELAVLVGRLRPLAGPRVPWGGPPARAVVHHAHTPGHTALWLPTLGVLVAGDVLSDAEPPLPEETGVAQYRAGLRRLLPFVVRAAVLVPGHGTPTTQPLARWRTDAAALGRL